MTITEKIKTTDNKIEQNKAQYNFERQTAKISALLLGNVCKCEFLTGKCFTKKAVARKSCYIKKISIISVRQRIKSTD